MGTTDSGLALLFSKLISRLFGLWAHPDWLVAHPVWIAGYLAAMLTLAGGWVIRTYASLEGLRPCNAHYETCATPDVSAADIANSDLYAVFETHKFGGYPTYRQDTPDSPDGYPYVMQIHSDVAAELNIGDVGSYYFYYNAEKNDRRVEMDCY